LGKGEIADFGFLGWGDRTEAAGELPKVDHYCKLLDPYFMSYHISSYHDALIATHPQWAT
jgi:hypothetical protein